MIKILGEEIEPDAFGSYYIEIGPYECTVYERAGKTQSERTGIWLSSVSGSFISIEYANAQMAANALTLHLRLVAQAIVGFAGGALKWHS
jgi:hypothetical protein